MDILDILLDILLKPPQPFIGLFFFLSSGILCPVPFQGTLVSTSQTALSVVEFEDSCMDLSMGQFNP